MSRPASTDRRAGGTYGDVHAVDPVRPNGRMAVGWQAGRGLIGPRRLPLSGGFAFGFAIAFELVVGHRNIGVVRMPVRIDAGSSGRYYRNCR